MSVLEVKVGAPIEASLSRFGVALETALAGQEVAPYFGIGFREQKRVKPIFVASGV
jgi:hypothetical protein